MKRAETAPLTEEDYERAAEEYLRGLPLEHFTEATPQGSQRRITLASFDLLRGQRPDVQLFNELLVQYPVEDGLGQVVPDNMVVLCPKAIEAGSFNLPFETARPFLVFEYISPYSKRKDYKDSFRKYEEQLRVPYCLLFYPERQDLRVYRHGGRRYRLLKPNPAGRLAVPELDLEVGLLDGWVRFWYRGKLLHLPADLHRQLDAERERADREERRADEAEDRAEQERRRAEQEKQRADALAAELERLKAQLGQTGKAKRRGARDGE